MAYVSVLFVIGAVLRGVVGIRALVNIGCLVLVIWVCIVARPEGVSCGTALDGWMDESSFLPREGQVVGGVVPLMAVNQPTRGKVGPVLDGRWMDGGVVLPWACRGR